MAEIHPSRFETLKARVIRTFYFLMGAIVGAAAIWAAVNVSDSAADTLNLATKADLVEAYVWIDELEDELGSATDEIQRFLELQRLRRDLDDLGTGTLQELLDRLNERAAGAP
ncbi:MAG: hypothetical protein J4N29_05470 [Chloroflexi bacterium]|nr:hypothetical protein [Chloroflexota bacterium]